MKPGSFTGESKGWRCQPAVPSTRTGTRSSALERMKISNSSASKYFGRPLSVLRVTDGSDRLQPNPKGPLTAPESYDSESCGPKPERDGDVKTGTVIGHGIGSKFRADPADRPAAFPKRDLRGAYGEICIG